MWTYGDAGDRYPVQVGDIWKIGGHVVACGDVTKGAVQELIELHGCPRVTYSDPPWNAGNVRAFRTKAGLNDGPVDWDNFLGAVLNACLSVQEAAFIEMGKATYQAMRQRIDSHPGGWRARDSWEIVYYRTKPCILTWATRRPHRPDFDTSPVGLDDTKTPAWVLSRVVKAGDLVLDPCLGRGLTAQAAHQHGAFVRGVELHPRRLAVGIDWLAKNGAGVPERIGTLNSMR